jgi:hypothetical protein
MKEMLKLSTLPDVGVEAVDDGGSVNLGKFIQRLILQRSTNVHTTPRYQIRNPEGSKGSTGSV